ncbi:hypothetical protein [Helicobacter bizzozeronii]|uniref:hypothetical protein n=1 Tax=Helicobacter bizzozeronii TaxID=56877 RepID=UPI0018F849C4|nr:hypothetical protein [Helicobacter bizzozeronii]
MGTLAEMTQRASQALKQNAQELLEGLNQVPNGSKTLVAAKALQEESDPQQETEKRDFSPFIIEESQGDMHIPSPQAGLPPSTGMWGLLGFLSQMALLRAHWPPEGFNDIELKKQKRVC